MPTNKQKKTIKVVQFLFYSNEYIYLIITFWVQRLTPYFFTFLLMFHRKLTSGHQHVFLSFEIQEANESSNYTIE
jgi:hypothetical protein